MHRSRLPAANGRTETSTPCAKVARKVLRLAALALLVAAAPASTEKPLFEAIREVDATMAQIGYRLATANAPLCDRLEPGLGLVIHTPGQYAPELRADAVRHFHLDGPVGVEAVIPGSPAALAGIEADDTLTGIGAVRFKVADAGTKASTTALIDATRRIAALPVEAVEVAGRRNGENYARTVRPVPACRTRFEVAISSDFSADADGEMVQISSRFFEEYPRDLVAAAIAHELAHNILRHRERLGERGVAYGLMSGFGRNVRYFRQTELEADILSVSLLANAGYDPEAAVRFWKAFGPGHAGGPLRSRSHPAWQDRVATIEKAIAGLGPHRPSQPAILHARDRPLDGNWQSLLVKAR